MPRARDVGLLASLLATASVLATTSVVGAAPEPPYNLEAHAEHLVGSIAASVGAVQRELAAVRSHQDVFDCVRSKLDELRTTEASARRARTGLRLSSLDDDNPDGPAYATLVNLEASARSLRDQAEGCRSIGSADRDSDGIVDKRDEAPDSDDRPVDSFVERVTALKQQVERARPRLVLLHESMLNGKTGGGTVPSSQAGSVTPPPKDGAAGEHDASMLIRTAEIAMAVFEVQKNVDVVEHAAIDLGGYLALRTDHEITVRVPRDQFDELVRRVERMGDVLHKNVAAEDVTDQYVDIDIRLKNARAVRDRLEKLLTAASVRDAIEIQKELAKVTGEIEGLEGKLKLMRDRIAYSTVTVSFEQTQAQKVKAQALLPFPWMVTMGLSPLLQVPR
jgi:Domain of unknown function (DUF4349)